MSIAKADRKCVHWQVSGQLFGHDGDTAPSPREPRLGVSRHRHDCLALSQGASVNARRPVRKPPQPDFAPWSESHRRMLPPDPHCSGRQGKAAHSRVPRPVDYASLPVPFPSEVSEPGVAVRVKLSPRKRSRLELPPGMKLCTSCNQVLPVAEFGEPQRQEGRTLS